MRKNKEKPTVGYVYALIDLVTLQIRYIGKTCKPVHVRCLEHTAAAKKKKKDGKYKNPSYRARWMRKNKFKFYKKTVETVPVDQLDVAEIKWIKYYREHGYPLTNMTDGGEGNRGLILTKAQRKRLSLIHTGISTGPRSLKTRKLISKGHIALYKTRPGPRTGLKNTKEQNRKIGLANSIAGLGRINSKKHNKSIAVGGKRRHALERYLKYKMSEPEGIKFNPKQAVLHNLSKKQLAVLAS